MTSAPAGIAMAGPTALTLPFSITITAPDTTAPAFGSIRRPALTATTGDGPAAAADARPTSRTTDRSGFMRVPFGSNGGDCTAASGASNLTAGRSR